MCSEGCLLRCSGLDLHLSFCLKITPKSDLYWEILYSCIIENKFVICKIYLVRILQFELDFSGIPTMRETWVQSLGQEDPLEKEMATHFSIFAWRIPWMEEPGGLQFMGSQRVRHDWATSFHFTSLLWGSYTILNVVKSRQLGRITSVNSSFFFFSSVNS